VVSVLIRCRNAQRISANSAVVNLIRAHATRTAPGPERSEHTFVYALTVADLPIPELVANRRRSVAMLPVGVPALNREEALEVLRQLGDALRRLRELERDR
jgi:hypothetical protein